MIFQLEEDQKMHLSNAESLNIFVTTGNAEIVQNNFAYLGVK